ncbi:hypothetical protein [Microbacterium sp. 2FI]|uniref:hypothetical protein n=1 Tax=Microbacterium sp. 2FI TaxID=2502193 RepID=UPI0010F8E91C|nr:hypothetical protein [Microbacterium sp. 2FI]
MGELDDFADQLERLTGDPLADAVRGHVRVVSASEPTGRARYQACNLDVVVEAAEIPPVTVSTEVVTTRKHWPRVGMILPARISVSDPTHMDVDWDALAR